MSDHTRTAARGTARASVEFGQTIATEGRHGAGIPINVGRIHPALGRQKGLMVQDFGGAKIILFVGPKIVVLRRDDK